MVRPILVLLLLLLPLNDALAWGQGHRLIREWAVARLPAWQREAVGARHLQSLCVDYKSLQDMHAGGKAPELDPYCKVPGIRLSLHDVNPPETSARAVLWYLDRIVEKLQAGETDEGMKFLGVLCHWNEDPGCPSAHSSPISEAQLKILIPPPADKARYNYLFGAGGIADVGRYVIPDEPYRPRLLGRSRAEIGLRILQHQVLLERNAARHIVPLVQDMMQGDGTKAAGHRASAAHYNAKHIADVIHTVLCLAYKRFESEIGERRQDLPEWAPAPMKKRTGHPYYVTGFLVNQAMDAKRKLHPLAFAGESMRVENGFGTGAPFAIDYTLAPATEIVRFTCRVGLHPTAAAAGEVAFAVVANGKELLRTKPLQRGDGPVSIDVNLPETNVLRLSLVTVPVDPARSTANLAVWAEPRLHFR